MTEQALWKEFLKTGSPVCYTRYRKAKEKADARTERSRKS